MSLTLLDSTVESIPLLCSRLSIPKCLELKNWSFFRSNSQPSFSSDSSAARLPLPFALFSFLFCFPFFLLLSPCSSYSSLLPQFLPHLTLLLFQRLLLLLLLWSLLHSTSMLLPTFLLNSNTTPTRKHHCIQSSMFVLNPKPTLNILKGLLGQGGNT